MGNQALCVVLVKGVLWICWSILRLRRLFFFHQWRGGLDHTILFIPAQLGEALFPVVSFLEDAFLLLDDLWVQTSIVLEAIVQKSWSNVARVRLRHLGRRHGLNFPSYILILLFGGRLGGLTRLAGVLNWGALQFEDLSSGAQILQAFHLSCQDQRLRLSEVRIRHGFSTARPAALKPHRLLAYAQVLHNWRERRFGSMPTKNWKLIGGHSDVEAFTLVLGQRALDERHIGADASGAADEAHHVSRCHLPEVIILFPSCAVRSQDQFHEDNQPFIMVWFHSRKRSYPATPSGLTPQRLRPKSDDVSLPWAPDPLTPRQWGVENVVEPGGGLHT